MSTTSGQAAASGQAAPSHQPPTPLPGSQFPLGATVGDGGVNFAVASAVADGIVLCLFDEGGRETQIPLRDYDAGVWHGFVPGIGAGQAYGYRATGPYDPVRGLRCNPAKLLADPYARAFSGSVAFGPEVLGYAPGDPDARGAADSAGSVPRSLVVADDSYRWRDGGGGAGPRHGFSDTVIYELHVKGFTMRHPGIPPELRGTYAGLGHEAAVAHLADLGVTAVELLPVHESVPESFLVERGLTNYWGYNTIGYFAPHQRYSAAAAGKPGGQVDEFKAMVDALHSAGLEVLLDVVFNHTAEGNHLGPTLCHRGLDNPAYYRLDPGDPRYYIDTTGTGNSLNAGDPLTLQLIMDSLRYWITQMHVDGFRFDLATTLGRQEGGYDVASAFFDMVSQDPVVSRAKLIAEPWDVGQMDSYDLGRFPPLWREWNGKYRDTMRDFWRSHPVGLREFATRFCGSSDLYAGARRRPTASVNLITVHDGFTLRDLVSYNDKHNEANGESNKDGTTDNRSWNCGAEGPTTDPDIVALRARQSRAMLATLLLSFGVPMLLGGDEMGRTQQGNNNAYCQDNEISWLDWVQPDAELKDFTQRLIAFRQQHPVFRRRRFLAGAEAAQLCWYTPAGSEMTGGDWSDGNALAVALYLDGSDDPDRAADGMPLVDDDFLVLVNAWWDPLEFILPITRQQAAWRIDIDSYDPAPPGAQAASAHSAGEHVAVGPRSIVVLADPRRG
ncbi:MAG TPA: glycogen debranching protein GlgX [Streptosporangiaceae bacterium]|nr:glycogen debranching protein GlgX [Streptosporangiaceae bacterium]